MREQKGTVDRRAIIPRARARAADFSRWASKDDTMSSDIGTPHHDRLDIANHDLTRACVCDCVYEGAPPAERQLCNTTRYEMLF